MTTIYRKKGKNKVGETVEVEINRSRVTGTWYGGRGIRYLYEIEGFIGGFDFDKEETTNKRKAITIANRMLKQLEKTTVSYEKDIEPVLVRVLKRDKKGRKKRTEMKKRYGRKDGSRRGFREGGRGRNRTNKCRHPNKKVRR